MHLISIEMAKFSWDVTMELKSTQVSTIWLNETSSKVTATIILISSIKRTSDW